MSIITPFRATDRVLYRLLHGRLRARPIDPIMVGATDIGTKSAAWLAVAGVLALFGDAKARRTAGLTVVATLTAQGLVNLLLKPAFRRQRPFLRQRLSSRLLIDPPSEPSWPSGHAASSAAAFTILVTAYPERAVPLVTLAAAIAYSRVYVGVHYPFDVGAGTAIGGLVGATIVGVARRHGPSSR